MPGQVDELVAASQGAGWVSPKCEFASTMNMKKIKKKAGTVHADLLYGILPHPPRISGFLLLYADLSVYPGC
jgi:hypothetical protein